MRFAVIAAACIVLVSCALLAGCTSPTQAEIKPVDTAVVTTAATETTQTPVLTATTVEPVVPLPENLAIDLTLSKDRPTGKLTLILSGGPGMLVAQTVRMKATLADGTINDQLMNGGGQLTTGSTIVIQGTRNGTDHCEVWVTTAGKVYKVIDQNISSLNPYA